MEEPPTQESPLRHAYGGFSCPCNPRHRWSSPAHAFVSFRNRDGSATDSRGIHLAGQCSPNFYVWITIPDSFQPPPSMYFLSLSRHRRGRFWWIPTLTRRHTLPPGYPVSHCAVPHPTCLALPFVMVSSYVTPGAGLDSFACTAPTSWRAPARVRDRSARHAGAQAAVPGESRKGSDPRAALRASGPRVETRHGGVCLLLVDVSGMVISIHPAFIIGLRIRFHNLVRYLLPITAISP